MNRNQAISLLGKAAKWTLFLVVVYFVVRAVHERFQAVRWEELQLSGAWAIPALLGTCASVLMVVVGARALLTGMGERLGWSATFGAICVSQVGKYVPGKAAAVLGGAWLLSRHGVPRRAAGAVMFLATGLSVVVALLMATPLAVTGGATGVPFAWLFCPLLAAAGLVCVHPKVFGRVVGFVLRRVKREPLEKLPGSCAYLRACSAFLFQWACLGAAMWAIARSLGNVPIPALPRFAAAAAMASALGFLALFAPAGLGVREAVFLGVLGPIVGDEHAAIVAVAMRLLYTLVEVGMALLGLVVLRVLRTVHRDVHTPV